MGNIPNSIIDRLMADECIVYPTTTLPGLGCIPTKLSLDRLFSLKNRPSNMPVSLAVSSIMQAEKIVIVPEIAKALISEFPPASVSIILDAHKEMDPRLGGSKVAIRLVAHPLAKELVEKVGPLTATSANPSGQDCPDSCLEASELLDLPSDAVLDGMCPGGLPSTLIRLSSNEEINQGSHSVTIMREGILPSSRVIEWLTNSN